MKLILEIEPKPQSRPRFTRRGNFVTTYEDKEMKIWRRSCAYLIKSLWKGPILDGSIKVWATFYIKPTKQLLNTKYKRPLLEAETIPVKTKPDLDNYIKALFDSVSDAGCIWQDDGRVVEMHARKVYSLKPRIEVEFEGWTSGKKAREAST